MLVGAEGVGRLVRAEPGGVQNLVAVGVADAGDHALIGQHALDLGPLSGEQGGELLKTDKWGRKKLAYEVQKYSEGYYTLFEYQAGSALAIQPSNWNRIASRPPASHSKPSPSQGTGSNRVPSSASGTTSSVQSMVLTACKRGDEIILPRNVHRSVLNALVLCGAVPVYVNPEVDKRLGISLGMKREQVAKAIKEHPNAVAVLVNNPTYYGICSDLRAIVKMAHDAGMLCLADEAHGTHFYFGGGLPVSAMAAGADMASVSMHKSGGSLTQSSLLLIGPNVHPGYVRQIINLTQTTSGSYLLMSSLDISRRNLAQRGRQVFHQVADMAEYAREEINAVGGYYAFGKELCNGNSVFDFDTTKLSVHTLDIGLAGIEVYDILRDEYDIQIEFGDIGNILAYLSIGDRPQEIERLVSALAEIKRRYHTDGTGLLSQEYIDPVVAASPQEAFYAPKKSLPLRETEGMVCSEFVMCYPPGIPILAPGERITKEILNYIEYAKAKGCSMTGPEDPDIERLNVLA